MFTELNKRAVIACLTLAALLLLAACAFPKIGGVKTGKTPTPEGAQAESLTPGPADTGSTETEPAAGNPDQPAADNGIAADFSDAENPPHGLILFASTSPQPFLKDGAEANQDTTAERSLWAVSLDGGRAGRVSPEGAGSALFISTTSGKKSRALQNGFTLAGDLIEPVDLPDECSQDGEQSCSGFQFSPNGNLLSYYSGPDSCGRRLTLFNVDDRKTVNAWSNVHWAYFFNDGSLMLSLGDCNSQYAYLYVPKTGKQAGVEPVGKEFWNPTHTAVIFQIQGKPELQAGLWGFNLVTSRVFLWPSTETAIEDSPIWLEDGQNFVFQHQPYTYDQSTKDAILNGPRQIILMNAWTRSQSLLGFDSRNNYHLCSAEDLASGEPGSPCIQPFGEWLRIQRQPYQALRFPVADRGKSEVRCALYGLDCKGESEILALNWKSSKQYPWEEARIPQATVTPGYNKPDLNQEPFYQDPGGEFTFYIGKDGKTLWYVPRDREPALWVQDAEGFLYLP